MTNPFEARSLEDHLKSSVGGPDLIKQIEARGAQNAVEHMRAALASIGSHDGPAQPIANGVDVGVEREAELLKLVRVILDKISETRDQISSIASMAKERDVEGFNSVGNELDAIINDTANATNTIMDHLDAITLLLDDAEGMDVELKSAIRRHCSDITMACSFQDITGQRVKKVVEVIELIDSEISSIESKLSNGPQTSGGLTRLSSRIEQKNQGLLDGPRLSGDRANAQEEIDTMFAEKP
jgi:chemotaxis regulatin CheY-phosphate phosphatase CheZ